MLRKLKETQTFFYSSLLYQAVYRYQSLARETYLFNNQVTDSNNMFTYEFVLKQDFFLHAFSRFIKMIIHLILLY